MSEIRFDGLYFYDGGKLWFRFHPKDQVDARYIDEKVTPRRAASLISPGQGGPRVARPRVLFAQLFPLLSDNPCARIARP